MNIEKLRYNVVHCQLNEYDVYKIIGDDRIQYLNGQTTNDVKKMPEGSFIVNSHLNKNGLLQSFFYVLKHKDFLYLTSG